MNRKTLLIIPVLNNRNFFTDRIHDLKKIENADILIVADGSDDGSPDLLGDADNIVCVQHELPLGYGASFITGCEYGRDMGYDILIFLDPENGNAAGDVGQMLSNMGYGYELVSCSRILENPGANSFREEHVSITENIASSIREVTGLDITDPLSGILAISTAALKNMELTDYTHGLLLQLWVQAAHFKLASIEIPASLGESFGRELDLYDDPAGLFLSVIETEKYLYPKGTMN
jgi:glycosyltransferase involved in cell wall biosynthesis